MNIERLDKFKNKTIYHVNKCQEKYEQSLHKGSQYEWLDILDILKVTNTSVIFKAILEKKNHIIIKEQPLSTTIKEFNMSARLELIFGFIKYICYFTCNDIPERYRTIGSKYVNNKIKICEGGRGESVGIILMPYYELKSIKVYKWSRENFEQLKSVIYQVVLSLYNAYLIEGFLHQDIHLDNILLKKVIDFTPINYKYPENITVNNLGLVIRIIDFGNSRVISIKNNDTDKLFNRDLYNFFSRLKYDLNLEINIENIFIGDPETYIIKLLELIQQIKLT